MVETQRSAIFGIDWAWLEQNNKVSERLDQCDQAKIPEVKHEQRSWSEASPLSPSLG